MKKSSSILDFYGNNRIGFLHANGRQATNTLLSFITKSTYTSILEIGFGTGATLVKLWSGKNKFKIAGVEVSPVMYRAAVARLKFCMLREKIDLILTDGAALPFSDHSFDIIFAESVLGILENDQLPNMISEIYRVLKPEGFLLLNETIWLEHFPISSIKDYNKLSRSAYGIIQANESFPYLKDWQKLMVENKFAIILSEPFKNENHKFRFNRHVILSDIFSLAGKIKSLILPNLRRLDRSFREKSKALKFDGQVMEGYFIIAKKTST